MTTLSKEVMLWDLYSRMEALQDQVRLTNDELYFLFMPHVGEMKIQTGHERHTGGRQRPFDSTGIEASTKFGGWLKSNVVPSTNDWLNFGVAGSLSDDKDIKFALDKTSERILSAIAASNFYTQAGALCRDLPTLGTSAMAVSSKPSKLSKGGTAPFNGFVFDSIKLTDLLFLATTGNDVSHVGRKFSMSPVEAQRFFNLEKDSKLAIDSAAAIRPTEAMQFVQIAFESENGLKGGIEVDSDQDFAVFYALISGNSDAPLSIIREAGADYEPIIVPRWAVLPGEVWGRGIGHVSRPLAKQSSKLREWMMRATARSLMPPLAVEDEQSVRNRIPYDGFLHVAVPARFNPQFLQTGADIATASAMLQDNRAAIKEAWFINLIDQSETQARSATAAQIEDNKTFHLLSPVADTMGTEWLEKVAMSCLRLMHDGGALPEYAALVSSNPELEVTISFTSAFFVAQQSGAVARAQQHILERTELFAATQDPLFLQDLDILKYQRLAATHSHVPDIFKSDAQIAAELEALAAQEARREFLDTGGSVEALTSGVDTGAAVGAGAA